MEGSHDSVKKGTGADSNARAKGTRGNNNRWAKRPRVLDGFPTTYRLFIKSENGTGCDGSPLPALPFQGRSPEEAGSHSHSRYPVRSTRGILQGQFRLRMFRADPHSFWRIFRVGFRASLRNPSNLSIRRVLRRTETLPREPGLRGRSLTSSCDSPLVKRDRRSG